MLYMDDTLDEKDVLMIWKYKTHLCRLHSSEGDLSLKFRCRLVAVDNEIPACVTCHGQLRMWTQTNQTNSHSPSFSFWDLELCIKHYRETRSYSTVSSQQPWCSIYKKKAALSQVATDSHSFPQYRSVLQRKSLH